MNKVKLLKTVKIISIILLVILVCEVGILIYNSFFKEDHSVYFDSINASSNDSSSYVAVGSNNNNKEYYEKAKITKYNSRGEKTFEKLYNKGFNSVFLGVITDNDGYVAVGSYEASEEEHDNKVRSALIVKYDKKGNLLFENSFQLLGNSKFMNLVKVDDGYLVVGQSVYENMTLGFAEGGAFLIKYDNNGRLLWKKSYGDNKTAVYNDLVVVDNYIYVVGKDDSRVGIVAKYDLDGTLVKTTKYEFTDSLGFMSIVKVSDGLVVSGAKRKDNTTDAILVKYDFDINYLNEVSYDENENERYNRLVVDNNDNLIVIGTIGIYDTKKDTTGIEILKYDAVIAKYKSDLKLIKTVRYGDVRDDYFSDVILRDNNYYVAGYSSYEDGSYLSKYIVYSDALKVLEVR